MPRRSVIERLERSYMPEPNSGCWIWIKGRNNKGYGSFHGYPGSDKAHRISWMMAGRGIPTGIHVLHKCDTPSCVNPDHLFLGTIEENNKDRTRKLRSFRKLTTDAVFDIRKREMNNQGYAEKYGIHQSEVSRIQSGKRWGHLKEV